MGGDVVLSIFYRDYKVACVAVGKQTHCMSEKRVVFIRLQYSLADDQGIHKDSVTYSSKEANFWF